MKLVYFNFFLLLITQYSLARDIILIDNRHQAGSELLVKRVLSQKFGFPESFIRTIYSSGKCSENIPKAIVYLCIENDGELKSVIVDDYIFKNTLETFIENNKGGNDE